MPGAILREIVLPFGKVSSSMPDLRSDVNLAALLMVLERDLCRWEG